MGRHHETLGPLVMPGYRPRTVDAVVGGALQHRGAVLIEGCRGCGKTWTARSLALSEARLDEEATLLLAAADPGAVLRGAVPRLLDEWQNAPELWNRVRRECDDRARAEDMAALVVVTSTGTAYLRADGVQVAPITALSP